MSVRLSVCWKACPIDNWRTLGPTDLKLGIEVGHDQDTLFNDTKVIRPNVKVTNLMALIHYKFIMRVAYQ